MIETGTCIDDRYEVGDLVARGGMADVYRANDSRLDREVAIKVVRESNDELVRRLVLESQILARLNHPAIVGIHDAGEHDGLPYLVMQFVEGSTLAARLHENGGLEPGEVAGIARPIAQGLAHAHELDVTHRDVKPGNVLLDPDDNPWLSDFGIAHALGSTRMTRTGLVMGTSAYLAPEQLAGRDVGPSADVYSLGLVLLECLTGERAFPGTEAETAAARLARDPDVPTTLPGGWTPLLRDMTTREAERRPSAGEVADRAGADNGSTSWAFTETSAIPAAEGTQVLPVQEAPDEPGTPGRRWRWSRVHTRVLVGALVLLAIVAGVVAGLMTTGSDEPSPSSGVTEDTQVDIPPAVQEAYDELRQVIRE